ncbi:unnamed protein product [Prorocentrum cordatum]|nr:unnamed protein product [Polarella glacialis]
MPTAHDAEHAAAAGAAVHRPGSLRASVRDVVRCAGKASAWAYRQRAWPLGAGAPAEGPRQEGAATSGLSERLRLHVEFDWEASSCAALVDGRVEGPFGFAEFGGAEPTVDQVRLQLSPEMGVDFAQLLVA